MPRAEADIRNRLVAFAAKWETWAGTEKSEAIPFLLELLACFGVDREREDIRFEVKVPSGYIDMLWPKVCLVEMKRPSQAAALTTHKDQAFRYWLEAGTEEHEPPRFVVLCANGRARTRSSATRPTSEQS